MQRATGRAAQALPTGSLTLNLLNRSAIILKPKRPFLEWSKQDDTEGLAESVFEALQEEPNVYLLPEYEDASSQQELLKEFWPALFEAMLEGWVTDEACWPRNRTFEMFQEWFEIQITSVVEDLDVDEPLKLPE